MAVFSTLKATVAAATVAVVAACGGHGGCSGHDHDDHSPKNDFVVTPEATASHILVDSVEKANEIKEKITVAISEGGDAKTLFAEAAKEHSSCPSKENGGALGHFEYGQMVPEFENVIFDKEQPIETVLGPIETQFGQHLIIIESRINGDGSKDGNVPVVKKATASHILVEEEEKCKELKQQIESFEDQAAEFAKLAAENSKCPSGAQAGGNLGSFRQGQMVPEFDTVIFGAEYALNKVYGPVQTQFGYHLIFIHERSGVEEEAAKEEVKAEEEVKEEEVKEEKKEEEEAQSEASTEAPESEAAASEETTCSENAEL